ncbi:hypothetical protein DPMN_008442 [Dreissena polymorpha]|uniref:Uncharacterized protein n=1 Tax=Dreissena polymorpha TaxID=45954 RepID=A0A9D4RZN6_DREPO|nr:hypothetical protein DPMN_008442 [Dreissena polymorpha]
MNLRIWLNAVLLCVLISGWIRSIAAGVHDEDDEDKLASSRRRCRCKKYFAQINRDP